MTAMNMMADSVKRAADMCQQMMEREMAAAPLKMAGAIALGLLLVVDLALLAVLQVQLIRHWSRRLRKES